jgi:hypothetical protein
MLRTFARCFAVFIIGFFTQHSGYAQYQAQNGWSKPQAIHQAEGNDNLVLDPLRRLLYLATPTGIERLDLSTSPIQRQTELATRGVRQFVGASNALGTALAWQQRRATDNDRLWMRWQGQERTITTGSFNNLNLAMTSQGPVLFYTQLEGDQTNIFRYDWQTKVSSVVYKTPLAIQHLGVSIGQAEQLLFAEGFVRSDSISRREKYDAVWLKRNPGSNNWQRKLLGPAVVDSGDVKYGFVVLDGKGSSDAAPLWWWETTAEQATGSSTGVHRPKLAFWDEVNQRIVAITPVGGAILYGNVAMQLGPSLVWSEGNFIRRVELLNWQQHVKSAGGLNGFSYLDPIKTQPIALSPNPITGFTAQTNPDNLYWSTLNKEVDGVVVYQSDTKNPYQPNVIDQISLGLGWNPWYPGPSMFSQSIFSLTAGAIGGIAAAGFAWILGFILPFGRWYRQGRWIGLALGWGWSLGAWGISQWFGAQPNFATWNLRPLLLAPWWAVLAALVIGSIAAWPLSKRAYGSELLVPGITGGLAAAATAVAVFSRAGFLQF